MKRIYLISLVVFLASCTKTPTSVSTHIVSSAETPVVPQASLATVTPVCISPKPTQEDIDAALSYAGDVFDPAEWQQSHVVGDDRVSVTWQNIPQSAVVFLEAIIFPCGYEEPDLDHYLNKDHWDTLFANYDHYEMLDQCTSDVGLRLYEFKATSQGYDYNISYWSENDTAERVFTTMITFPFVSESTMQDYSIKLFPELPNCS